MGQRIKLAINGEEWIGEVEPSLTLLRLIRERLGLTGTKAGCEMGECGACSVLMDGEPVESCLVLAVEADGHAVETVESLAKNGELHLLQQAFYEKQAVQCGFCTPGILMAAKALLKRSPHPTRDEIRTTLSGHLCRCTGYDSIVDAIEYAASKL
jgi:carbon-monoxide dehydrogenase small subunit